MSKPWLYAIANGDGTPFMSEDCVCQDREPLDDLVHCMNGDKDPEQKPFRVVALYRRKRVVP